LNSSAINNIDEMVLDVKTDRDDAKAPLV